MLKHLCLITIDAYIYNKSFYEAYFNVKHNPDVDTLLMMANNEATNTNERFDLIRNWAATRGLYDQQGNSHTQYVKLQEEAGELAKALLNG